MVTIMMMKTDDINKHPSFWHTFENGPPSTTMSHIHLFFTQQFRWIIEWNSQNKYCVRQRHEIYINTSIYIQHVSCGRRWCVVKFVSRKPIQFFSQCFLTHTHINVCECVREWRWFQHPFNTITVNYVLFCLPQLVRFAYFTTKTHFRNRCGHIHTAIHFWMWPLCKWLLYL